MADDRNTLVPAHTACRILGGDEKPLNASTLYRGIKAGRFPAPIKVTTGTSRWRLSDLKKVLDGEPA